MRRRPTQVLGKHAIYDLSGCDAALMNSPSLLREIVMQAATVAEITVLGSMDHHFEPQGYSIVLILEESHLSLHTWPENGYVSIDLFSCSARTDFAAVHEFLVGRLRPVNSQFSLLKRGPYEPVPQELERARSDNGHA